MDREADHERYEARETEDGALLITDTENDEAWIRCDETVSLSWQT